MLLSGICAQGAVKAAVCPFNAARPTKLRTGSAGTAALLAAMVRTVLALRLAKCEPVRTCARGCRQATRVIARYSSQPYLLEERWAPRTNRNSAASARAQVARRRMPRVAITLEDCCYCLVRAEGLQSASCKLDAVCLRCCSDTDTSAALPRTTTGRCGCCCCRCQVDATSEGIPFEAGLSQGGDIVPEVRKAGQPMGAQVAPASARTAVA
jgi:hypothetical protein